MIDNSYFLKIFTRHFWLGLKVGIMLRLGFPLIGPVWRRKLDFLRTEWHIPKFFPKKWRNRIIIFLLEKRQKKYKTGYRDEKYGLIYPEEVNAIVEEALGKKESWLDFDLGEYICSIIKRSLLWKMLILKQ